MSVLFTDLYFYLKRLRFDLEGVYTPRISPEKRISNTPSFVFKHLCTKFTKWAQNDIFAAKTTENPASDDTNVKLFLYVAEVLILVLTSVVLIKRTAATSNITDVLASDFVPTPLCLT